MFSNGPHGPLQKSNAGSIGGGLGGPLEEPFEEYLRNRKIKSCSEFQDEYIDIQHAILLIF